jgi:hypothetical protein
VTPEDVKRLSHDFKNALNGVAVNLEVLRMRAPGDNESLMPFINHASDQLDKLAEHGKILLELVKESDTK